MDNTLVCFQSGINQLSDVELVEYEGRFDEVPNIFGRMIPLEGAIEAFNQLAQHFDIYILSTAPWENPTAWSDKIQWVQKYLGESAYKRLTLSHNKNLLIGDYLVDDRTANGAGEFNGELLLFGSEEFPNWEVVVERLMSEV